MGQRREASTGKGHDTPSPPDEIPKEESLPPWNLGFGLSLEAESITVGAAVTLTGAEFRLRPFIGG